VFVPGSRSPLDIISRVCAAEQSLRHRLRYPVRCVGERGGIRKYDYGGLCFWKGKNARVVTDCGALVVYKQGRTSASV